MTQPAIITQPLTQPSNQYTYDTLPDDNYATLNADLIKNINIDCEAFLSIFSYKNMRHAHLSDDYYFNFNEIRAQVLKIQSFINSANPHSDLFKTTQNDAKSFKEMSDLIQKLTSTHNQLLSDGDDKLFHQQACKHHLKSFVLWGVLTAISAALTTFMAMMIKPTFGLALLGVVPFGLTTAIFGGHFLYHGVKSATSLHGFFQARKDINTNIVVQENLMKEFNHQRAKLKI